MRNSEATPHPQEPTRGRSVPVTEVQKRPPYRSTVWLPEHKRKRNNSGSWLGVSSGPEGTVWRAGCECGATFRGQTKEGRDRFRTRHAECQAEECECCGRRYD